MRIGLEAKRAFHNFRGLGNYARTLMEGLVQFAPENQYFSYTTPYNDQRALSWGEGIVNRHKIMSIITPRKSSLWSVTPGLWRRWGLVGDVHQRQLDVFHGLSHELPEFSKLGKPALVVTVHDLIFMRFPQFFPWIDRHIYAWKLKHACASADLIVAICEQTARDLEEFMFVPRNKIRVVYQSVSDIFEQPIDAAEKKIILHRWQLQEKNYLLMVGAFEARKNQENLIRAFSKLKNIPPLILIGRGERYQQLLQQLVDTNNLHSRVHFLNDVPFNHLPALYHGAIASVYPSHFEGFGLPLVESLSVGTPVITSRGSCFPEAAGPGAIYIDPDDVNALAKAIEQVVQDSTLRARLSSEGREYVKRFHARTTTEQMNGIYREALAMR